MGSGGGSSPEHLATRPWKDGQPSELAPMSPAAYLVVVHGPEPGLAGEVVRVELPELLIGRVAGPSAFAVGEGDRSASRQHCVLRWLGDPAHGVRGLRLEDKGSTNGTFVNGRPLGSGGATTLCDGDVVRAGDTLFVLRYGEPVASAFDDPILPGRCPAVSKAREWLHKLAPHPLPVLILGETGTGKEGAASGLHARSGRAGPFVALDCGTLQPNLAQSELFGSLKGAFTGSTETRRGLVATAANGTLFLDELGLLDGDVQTSLLRFLQDGTYRAVGGIRAERSTARIVAATNTDLDEAVRAGTFREDLLARLRSVTPAVLPPLRERREDILEWAQILTAQAAGQLSLLGDVAWDSTFAEALLLHPWPRNLRELKEAVLTATLSGSGEGPLGVESLPVAVVAELEHARRQTPPSGAASPSRRETHEAAPADRPPHLDGADAADWEWYHAALSRHGGNVRMVARELAATEGHAAEDLDAETLDRFRKRAYRRTKALGLDVEQYRSAAGADEPR